MNNEARIRRIHNRLRIGPFLLKTAAIFAAGIGKSQDVFWLEFCGICSLVTAWYWLDFNIYRELRSNQ
jgi:hypothetical protein